MDPFETRATAAMTGELLSDLGRAVFGGRVPSGRSTLVFWIVAITTGVPLWFNVAAFIDGFPGTGFFFTGLWILFAVVTLGVTAAFLWAPRPDVPDHDLPSNER